MKQDGGRREKTGILLAVAVIPLVSAGCATRQQAVELESSVAEIKESNEKTAGEIQALKDLVLAEHDLIMSTKADILAEMSKLEEQVYMMENRLAERTGEAPAAFGAEAEGPVDQGEGPGEAPPAGAEESGEVLEGEILQKPQTGGVDERVMYDTAFLDMTRGKYELAIEGFRDFIENARGSQLLDNAQYWIGECHYALGDLRKAIEEFQKVVDQYPRGNKIPSALFKIGKCYFELGDSDAARRYFKSVVDGYPRSEEANLSRDYLSEL